MKFIFYWLTGKKVHVYEGLLGYEALICKCCGKYYDSEEPDEFSKGFMD